MESKQISKWLDNTFSKEQLDLLPSELLNKNRILSKVHDIKGFIENCELKSQNVKKAGQHRLDDWEKGWSGKGVYYSDDEYNNLPYYFKNNGYVRLDGTVFKDIEGFAEVDFLRSLQLIIFKSFLGLTSSKSIVEYGCGTGSNIDFIRKNLSVPYKFYGTDWAKSACIKLIENKILDSKCVFQVNYFDKNTFKSPEESYIAFTNASLEQAGNSYEEFIDYLINDTPCEMGIHIEPIRELLDLSIPLNLQSHKYEQQRGYLENFMSVLKRKRLRIIQSIDYGIGSHFINGYQVVVWIKDD